MNQIQTIAQQMIDDLKKSTTVDYWNEIRKQYKEKLPEHIFNTVMSVIDSSGLITNLRGSTERSESYIMVCLEKAEDSLGVWMGPSKINE